MITETAGTSVRSSVEVAAPIERAFRVFTDEIGSWWDPTHHVLEAELAEMVFEPRVGGHVYDRGVDGSECRWARVLAYEPPHRFVISWDVNLRWKLETDPARTSEVEVRFTEQGPDRTLVGLEHRHLERHGDGWEHMRDAVASPGGWPAGMRAFADLIAADRVHAVLIEVDVGGVDADAGLRALREQIVPAIKSMPGFQSGTWLTGNDDGKGLSLTLWDDEQHAIAMADRFGIGSGPTANASTVRCELREVAATA